MSSVRNPGKLGQIGLALSGGGVRATVFHLGVLARIAEDDLLESVSIISSFSGGSLGIVKLSCLAPFPPRSATFKLLIYCFSADGSPPQNGQILLNLTIPLGLYLKRRMRKTTCPIG